MNTARYASAPRMGGAEPYAAAAATTTRSLTPNRYLSTALESSDMHVAAPGTPSSTGLIRLSLKKPMGIVFEPMYDPNQKSLQRGVRICDLPRTGAAALSRKLQVGDELLQINDRTVSRLNFDQIMDIIIEADPESVNLLFRRPRKETLQARQGVKQKLQAAANKDQPSTVKWVDDGKDTEHKKEKKDKKAKRSKKTSVSEDEDATLQSSMAGDESYAKPVRSKSKKNSKSSSKTSRKDPYESESFLDVLIDTICANSNNVCRDTFRRPDDEYFSDDDESFASDVEDESTYVTYDESIENKNSKRKKKKPVEETETEDDNTRPDTTDDDEPRLSSKQLRKEDLKPDNKQYEDDGTLETNESQEERLLAVKPESTPVVQPPLGLAPQPIQQIHTPIDPPVLPAIIPRTEMMIEEDVINPAPIKELEYDDRIDHGADVSVMESLGGPSLLIEKQRAAIQASQQKQIVPPELLEKFGLDYPANYGFTREQTIEADPLKFYTHVVKSLLEEHEPEKVRLLDKLLAKYKGREDHLVQKLAVRYDRPANNSTNQGHNNTNGMLEENDEAFTDAVKKSKASSSAANAVHVAKERMHMAEPATAEHAFEQQEWPDKETKEQDIGDDDDTGSGSDYSRDSVDGTSPAVIAQVSELLNYVYGKTSVPGQIDRVSTIMRAYEGREAVLLELLETKALLKANKEKENADNLPSFLRSNPQHVVAAQKNGEASNANNLPPVTPMATQPVTDDISSMSGVSSPAHERDLEPAGIVSHTYETEEVEVTHNPSIEQRLETGMQDGPKVRTSQSSSSVKPPPTPEKDKKKKKGLFGGLFGKKKQRDGGVTPVSTRAGSRVRNRK